MKNFKFRLRFVYLLIFAFAVVLATRLFFIQVLDREYYRRLAEQQYGSPSAEDFDRGTIFFKKKDGQLISAATVKNGFQLVINPKILKNHETVYRRLSEIVALDKKTFLSHAQKTDDPYEVLARRLDDDTANKIKELDIKGVNVYSEAWRYYPGENLASNVLGFVGYKGDSLVGRYGIEGYYDSVLKRDGEKGLINSFIEIFSDIKRIITDDFDKGDIVLTIEPVVQSTLEKELTKAKEKYGAQSAGGIIIEPSTGRILAMVSKPDFDPNTYGDVDDISVFANSTIESIFEPGSIMKPLTIAAAIDQGVINKETTYNDKGSVIIDGRRIENYDGRARGVVKIQEILNQSLNLGAIFAMRELGKERFSDYLVDFGFGEKTNIDLPGEVRGMISNVLGSPREVEYATASFGQGIAITPIAMASAFSALANGGILMKPYIVDEIRIDGELDRKIEPLEKMRIFKKETSEEMNRMLTQVVDEALMGGQYKLDRYTVAAKTGTAQYVEEGRKGYVEGQYIHTFFGYAPAFDAKFLTLLYLVKPQGVRYASHSLTVPFMEITNFLLNYYQVPPDR